MMMTASYPVRWFGFRWGGAWTGAVWGWDTGAGGVRVQCNIRVGCLRTWLGTAQPWKGRVTAPFGTDGRVGETSSESDWMPLPAGS